MFKLMRYLLIATLLLLGASFFNFNSLQTQAADPNASVVCVYATWSVTSRNIIPVVEQVAGSFKLPVKKYDIDSSTVSSELEKINLSVPDRTPYIAVLKQGKPVFQKSYPNGTPEQVKTDLSNVISSFY